MNKYLPGLLLFTGAAFLLYAFTKQKPKEFAKGAVPSTQFTASGARTAHSHPHSAAHTHDPQMEKSFVQTPPVFVPNKNKSETAVTHMNALLKSYALGAFTLNDVIDDLEKRNMEPVLLTDANDHTGTMYVLRTESPLPGTRYFHAQYFTDGKKEPFLQHMSFDVKPEKTAFQDSIAAIKKIFGKLQAPTINKKGFVMWPWKNGYNIWVQKMEKEDLEGDPFNAYAANDEGTIKIAVELDAFHAHPH